MYISDFMSGGNEKEWFWKIIDDANKESLLFKGVESIGRRLKMLKEARRK